MGVHLNETIFLVMIVLLVEINFIFKKIEKIIYRIKFK